MFINKSLKALRAQLTEDEFIKIILLDKDVIFFL
jgi:hypothetical protein